MQKYPGRPRHLPLSGEREREAAVPHDLSTSSVGGRGDRKGEVPRGPRAPGPCALREEPRARRPPALGAGTRLWGTVRWAGKMGTGLGSGTPSAVRACQPCTCCPAPAHHGVPGPRRRGGGAFLSPPLARREGRTPRGLGERRAWDHNFLRPEGGRAGVGAHAAPGESARPGTPAVGGGGRRPGQPRTEALTWTRLGTPRENFRRGWREAGERGPARARHLAPRIPRPLPRAPSLACVPSRLHRPRS